jgi:hypothetical protein
MWPKSDLNNIVQNVLETRVAMLTTTRKILPEMPVLAKYSDLNKLQRVMAWVLRFIHNANPKNKNKLSGSVLTVHEMRNSRITIVRLIQSINFFEELEQLRYNKPISRESKLLTLDPCLDENGLIRVGGRLKHANISNDIKQPIILPKNHHVTKLIIKNEHRLQLHAGAQATLAAIRRRYWILSGRTVIRQVIHHCLNCFKAKPTCANPKTANLPEHRVQPGRPFQTCGVDYAGPVLIRESRGRGKRALLKSYIVIFVCFTTKAIHIELVTELTTAEFLAALRRFVARRGLPQNIYSDNATNFVGANNELIELQNFFEHKQFKNQVMNQLVNMSIKWHFIPPRSPHMGGLWEINVKSVKQHLKKILGETKLTYLQRDVYSFSTDRSLLELPTLDTYFK